VFPVRHGLHSAYRVYQCVPYGSHNKQRLFLQTAITGLSSVEESGAFPVRYKLTSYDPINDILHRHCRENFKSYTALSSLLSS
jgi:hypothetical protein